jgi:LmbE family N-acetylglucosaminyl deacetylase
VALSCVFFHAHPDDEALFTAGTMAMLADEGHRVVLVVATLGERGLAGSDGGDRGLDEVRRGELEASAKVLGCARVVWLGYRDSGWDWGAPVPGGAVDSGVFAATDVEQAAVQLAALLRDEDAHLLTIYDPAGGYGHPDHIQVNRVGARAADLAGTPVVLQATYDRARLLRLVRVGALLRRFLPAFDPSAFERAYSPATVITHRVEVRRYLHLKRASLAAHSSQTGGGDAVRTVAWLLRLPGPIARRYLGTEYFVQPGVDPARRYRHPLEGDTGCSSSSPAGKG